VSIVTRIYSTKSQ